MKSANIGYLPQVDHLRAVAAIWIVLYHGEQLLMSAVIYGTTTFNPATWIRTNNPFHALVVEGHSAVALFMVLSGFIFTYGAYGQRIRYKEFIINRVLRIYPLYITILLFELALSSNSYSLSSIVVTLLPLADFNFTGIGVPVPMAWAVAVEFQFYLLFPFLLARLNESPNKTILGVVGVALTFRIMGIALWKDPQDYSYWHLLGRIDQFMFGMAAAVALRNFRTSDRVSLWLSLCSALLVIGLLFSFHLLGGWPLIANWKIFWPSLEGFVYALLIVGYVGAPQLLPTSIGWVLSKVGEASFSIYLLRMLVIQAWQLRPSWVLRWTDDGATDGLLTTILFILPVVIALSLFTYRVVELPFLRLRRRYLETPPDASLAVIPGEADGQPMRTEVNVSQAQPRS